MMKRHPIETTIREAVYAGREPSREELDALKLPPSIRAQIEAATQNAVATWRAGHRGKANERALEAARNIVADLPDHLADPDYARDDPLRDVTDPAELADAVDRF